MEMLKIRKDYFEYDIEFLIRRGIKIPALSPKKRSQLRKIIEKFSASDFKVTLGSVLESESREYYIKNRFTANMSPLKGAFVFGGSCFL